jgi:hypothetical protein
MAAGRVTAIAAAEGMGTACTRVSDRAAAANWLRWWQLFIRGTFPKRRRGRQPKSGAPSG